MAKDEDDREMADVRLKKEFPSQGAAIGGVYCFFGSVIGIIVIVELTFTALSILCSAAWLPLFPGLDVQAARPAEAPVSAPLLIPFAPAILPAGITLYIAHSWPGSGLSSAPADSTLIPAALLLLAGNFIFWMGLGALAEAVLARPKMKDHVLCKKDVMSGPRLLLFGTVLLVLSGVVLTGGG